MRLLLVEDDPILGDGLAAALREDGYAVDWLSDGVAASAALAAEPFDLVVLDINLPRRSGLDVLTELRRQGESVPVLLLTARDTLIDRVAGLDAGADDYLIKPFDIEELCARLRALARRRGGRAHPLLAHGGVVLDLAAHTATLNGTPVELAQREFALLALLVENAGTVFSRQRIENHLYAWGEEPGSNAVEVHIHHLRRKLGADFIRTVRGAGYVAD
ncbi:MAG: response regulator [Gammaproteobacteria bacterium]|nr:response regulator [Gammaproteobacteria bacterium]